MFADLVHNVRDAVEAPLTEPLDAVHLFLIVGIVIVSIGAWFLILSSLREVVPIE